MDKIVTTQHIVPQQDKEYRTITKQEEKKIMKKKNKINKSPMNRHSSSKDNGHDSVIRARCGRIIKKPNRLSY